MLSPNTIKFAYLVAAGLFIFGLKFMAHPRTAVRGNRLGAAAMVLALLVTLLDQHIYGYWLIMIGIAIGGGIGIVVAKRIEMTANAAVGGALQRFGGGASVLVAGAELLKNDSCPFESLVAIAASGMIGAVTFWGSLVAFGKLQEIPQLEEADQHFQSPAVQRRPGIADAGAGLLLRRYRRQLLRLLLDVSGRFGTGSHVGRFRLAEPTCRSSSPC